jgi:hypothetical protein
VGSQTANAYFNGSITNITSVSFLPISGPNGVIAFAGCFASGSAVTCNLTGSATTQGTYTGTATITTATGGMIGLPVTLTIGGSTPGLSVSPNPVTLTASSVGAAVNIQSVTLSYDGQPVTPTGSVSYTTSSGGSWLQAYVSGSSVAVSGFSAGLGIGTYSGTVTVNTSQYGSTSFQVNLNVGMSGGLSATPNPVALSAATAGAMVFSQIVSINFNGSPASITGISSATSTNQNWLVTSSNGTTVNVTANTAGLATGIYTGTVTVSTTLGSTTFQVNLTVGSGSAISSPLSVSPSSLQPFSFPDRRLEPSGAGDLGVRNLGLGTSDEHRFEF